MHLDKITFLIRYINGSVSDRSDDIIRYSELYDYICRIVERLTSDGKEHEVSTLREYIKEITNEYDEKVSGARRRLTKALEIIIIAYYAALIKRYSDEKLEALISK